MKIYVSKKERFYFFIMVLIGLFCYGTFLHLLFNIKNVTLHKDYHFTAWLIAFYGSFHIFRSLLRTPSSKGVLVAPAFKITDKQFPEYYEVIKRQSALLDLKQVPDVYLVYQGGFLNAFAMSFLGKNVLVLYTSLLEHALKEGRAELEFIIAHELGHVKRRHTSFWWNLLIAPAKFIPFLGKAYSRACEYTCDGIAHSLAPSGSAKGLLLLVTGRELLQHVDVNLYLESYRQNRGWVNWFFEISSSHPSIPERILALQEFA